MKRSMRKMLFQQSVCSALVRQRVQYKLFMIVYRGMHGQQQIQINM